MAFRRPKDEWSLVVQKQAELNRQLENEERSRMLSDKHNYKQDLLFQQQLRDHQRAAERKERELDAQDVQYKINMFQSQEQQKRQQEQDLKKQFAQDYQTQQNFRKRQQEEEKRQKFLEEQEHLRRVQQQLDLEKKKAREARLKQKEEEEMMVAYKKHQENERKRQIELDKQREVELNRQRALQEEQKEHNYREYYKQLNEGQKRQVVNFSKAVSSQNERNMKINMWIDKNYREQQELLAQKEAYERNMREENLRNINMTLKQQVMEKEMARRKANDEYQREVSEMNFRVNEIKRLEQEREAQRRAHQQMYRDQLNTQAVSAQENRMSQYKLSELEKKMNKHVFADSSLQRGGAQIMKPNQSYDNIRNLQYDKGQANSRTQERPPPFASLFKDAPFQKRLNNY